MTIQKPIWCKCGGHSWTRKQLYSAWENDKPIQCPDPACQREISVEIIEELLKRIGMIRLDDEGK
jgi:hypothetical protein